MQPLTHTQTSGILRTIDGELNQVRKLIISSVGDGVSDPIHSAVCEIRNTIPGGKMFRPALVILSYRASQKGLCKKDNADELVRTAAVFEMIHNATLMHDDVIDQGQKRRGIPTVNNLLGNEAAVLLGDFLLSKVFKMCADLKPPVLSIIAAAAEQTCRGELRQIIQKGNWQMSESEYLEIVTEKTAALFSGCCQSGAVLAGSNNSQVGAMRRFGLNLGMAFQITDDLLDIIGDESKTGKTLGSDAGKNKPTLAVIHLLKKLGQSRRDVVIRKLDNFSENKSNFMEMLMTCGSLEYARDKAQEFVAKAIKNLADLKESDAKSALVETAEFVAGRVVVS